MPCQGKPSPTWPRRCRPCPWTMRTWVLVGTRFSSDTIMAELNRMQSLGWLAVPCASLRVRGMAFGPTQMAHPVASGCWHGAIKMPPSLSLGVFGTAISAAAATKRGESRQTPRDRRTYPYRNRGRQFIFQLERGLFGKRGNRCFSPSRFCVSRSGWTRKQG